MKICSVRFARKQYICVTCPIVTLYFVSQQEELLAFVAHNNLVYICGPSNARDETMREYMYIRISVKPRAYTREKQTLYMIHLDLWYALRQLGTRV